MNCSITSAAVRAYCKEVLCGFVLSYKGLYYSFILSYRC